MNEDSLQKITAALLLHNIPHVFVGVIPFSREITANEPIEGTEYLPYGSTSLTVETQCLGWRGQYFDPETFRTEAYLPHHPTMLNATTPYRVCDAIEFLRKQDPKSLWFTRPTQDLKSYSGQVIEAEECANWLTAAIVAESSSVAQLTADTPIILSEPRVIQAEWRWFVVDGVVVDGSMYRHNGELFKSHIDPFEDPAMIVEAQEIADRWLPHPCCVMDLALVDGEVRLLEFNTVNSSGFYDHDVGKIIKALWDYFVKTAPEDSHIG